jgi:hypothetical protein
MFFGWIFGFLEIFSIYFQNSSFLIISLFLRRSLGRIKKTDDFIFCGGTILVVSNQ